MSARPVYERIVSDHFGARERRAEYSEQLYQGDPPAVSLDAGVVAIPLPLPAISEEPLTLAEVEEATYGS